MTGERQSNRRQGVFVSGQARELEREAVDIIRECCELIDEDDSGVVRHLLDKLERQGQPDKWLEAGAEVVAAYRLQLDGRLAVPPEFGAGKDTPIDLGVRGMNVGGVPVGLEVKADRQKSVRRHVEWFRSHVKPELDRIVGADLNWQVLVDGSPLSTDEIGELRRLATPLIAKLQALRPGSHAVQDGQVASVVIQVGRTIRFAARSGKGVLVTTQFSGANDGWGRVADRAVGHANDKNDTTNGHPFVLEYVSLGRGNQFITPGRLAHAWDKELRGSLPDTCVGIISTHVSLDEDGQLRWDTAGVFDESVAEPLDVRELPTLRPTVYAHEVWSNVTEHIKEIETELRATAERYGGIDFDALYDQFISGSPDDINADVSLAHYTILCSNSGHRPHTSGLGTDVVDVFPCHRDRVLEIPVVPPSRR